MNIFLFMMEASAIVHDRKTQFCVGCYGALSRTHDFTVLEACICGKPRTTCIDLHSNKDRLDFKLMLYITRCFYRINCAISCAKYFFENLNFPHICESSLPRESQNEVCLSERPC